MEGLVLLLIWAAGQPELTRGFHFQPLNGFSRLALIRRSGRSSFPELMISDVGSLIRDALRDGGTDGLCAALAMAEPASLLDALTAEDWTRAVLHATGDDIRSRSSAFTSLLSELGRSPADQSRALFWRTMGASALVSRNFSAYLSRDDLERPYRASARATTCLELLSLMSQPHVDCPPDVVATSAAACCCFAAAAAAAATADERAHFEAAGESVLRGDWRRDGEGRKRRRKSGGVRVKRGGRSTTTTTTMSRKIEVEVSGAGGVDSLPLLGGVLPVLFEDDHVVCISKPAGKYAHPKSSDIQPPQTHTHHPTRHSTPPLNNRGTHKTWQYLRDARAPHSRHSSFRRNGL
jgi:hypothetical protein